MSGGLMSGGRMSGGRLFGGLMSGGLMSAHHRIEYRIENRLLQPKMVGLGIVIQTGYCHVI